MESRPRRMEIGLTGLDGGRMWLRETPQDRAARLLQINVPADSVAKLSVFVADNRDGEPREGFAFNVRALDRQGGSDSHAVTFERPEN
jgi:hypothetical protein